MARKSVSGSRYGGLQRPARPGALRRPAVAPAKRSIASRTARWKWPAASIGISWANGRTFARACGPPPANGRAKIASVGVDTWGVDFGLLGRGDELLGNPYHYRDSRTNGMMERAFGIVSREKIFRPHRASVPADQHALPTAGDETGRLAAVGHCRVAADGARPVPLAADGREVQRNDRGQHEPVLQSRRGRLGHGTCSSSFRCPRGSWARSSSRERCWDRCGPTWPPKPAWPRPRSCCPARTIRPAR